MSAVRVRHRPPAFAREGRASQGEAGLQPRRLGKPLRNAQTQNGRPGVYRSQPADIFPGGSGLNETQTDSFNSLEARKATFLLALIWIASPVAGLRPMRAARLRT